MIAVRRIWVLAFAVATPLALSSAAFVYFGMRAAGKPLTLGSVLIANLPDWYLWAALTPLVFWLGRRFPLGRDRWLPNASIHLLAGTAIVLAELAVVTAVDHAFYYNPYAPAPPLYVDAYIRQVLRSFHYAVIIYWLIAAAATAFRYFHEYDARERDAARLGLHNAELQSELTRAQLEMLRAQLQPHFLFNALNAIAGLVRERRNEAATELVAGLGQLLRHALSTADRDEIALSEELDVLESYLCVERARFRERLIVHVDVAPETLPCAVPSLILQPLVENAIRHGLRNETENGEIWISARLERGLLELTVRDNGCGLGASINARRDANGAIGESGHLGLRNTRARLERLYGHACTFELVDVVDGGALARVRIPQRERAARELTPSESGYSRGRSVATVLAAADRDTSWPR
jgi:signal transduction histidine kinase